MVNKQPMSQEKKNKIGNVLSAFIVVLCILLVFAVNNALGPLFWFLIIVNLVSGPACLILYLREVRSGIFAYDESDDITEAEGTEG